MIHKDFETKIQIQDIIENQIPEFVLSENPKFTEFLRQYYTSLENQGSPYDIIENLDQYIKLDNFRPEIVAGSSKLVGSITSTDTDITVTSTKGFPDKYGLVKIDNEIITYRAKTSTQFLDCVRGFSGVDELGKKLTFLNTSAESHANDANIENLSVLFLKEFYNKLKFTLLPELQTTNLHKEVNINTFLSNSSSFYRSKGSHESIKILFKALYNIDPIIVDLEQYLMKSSSANYLRRDEVIFQTVSSSNVDPSKLIGQQIFKNNNLNLSAPVSEIEILTREGRSYFKFLFFIGNDENTSSPVDNFTVTPSSKLILPIKASEQKTSLTLDSTISFDSSGRVFYVDENDVKNEIFYKEKTLNQLLGCYSAGYDYINVDIPKTSIIYDNDLYFGYEDGDFSKRVELILLANSSSIEVTYPDKNYAFFKGETGYITEFGKPLNTNKLDNLSKIEKLANSLYFNTSIRYEVSSFNARNLILTSRIDNPSVLRVGDQLEFLERNTEISARKVVDGLEVTINELTSTTINSIRRLSNGTFQIEIDQDTADLDVNTKYDIRRIVKTATSTIIPLEYTNLTSDITNSYVDDDNSLYISSNSLPSYPITKDIFKYQIQSIGGYINSKFKWSTITLPIELVNGLQVYPSLVTGDAVYYDYTDSPIGDLQRGLYYVEIQSDKNSLKLYRAKTSIGTEQYILFDNNIVPDGTHTFTLYAQKTTSGKVSPKKLLKKVLNQDTDIEGDYDIGTNPVGMLVNGVEISSPNAVDKIYYGAIESTQVINPGDGYDIMNPPQLRFETGDAKIEPIIHGTVKDVLVDQQLFDIEEPVNISITGGNSNGCVLKPIVLFDSRSVLFNARSVTQGGGLDPDADTISFLQDHNFYDGQKVYYDVNDLENAAIGIGQFNNPAASTSRLTNNSAFYVDIVNSRTIRLYPSLNDYSAGINTVGLGTEGNLGLHKFRTEPRKKLKKIIVGNDGTGFTYRKLTVSQSGISTTNDLISFKNHGFETGELVDYSYETSSIDGLDANNKYYVLKLDDNSFRLCDAGVNGTISTNIEQQKYAAINSTGSGYQYFKYPDIEVTIDYQNPIDDTQKTIVATPIITGGIVDTYVYEGGQDYGSTILNVEKTPDVKILSGRDGLIRVITEKGRIVRALVLYAGSEYYSIPDLEVTDPTGSGAILRAEISNGRLSGVEIIEPGINYSTNATEVRIISRGQGALFSPKIRTLSVNNAFKYGTQYTDQREPTYDILESDEDNLTYSLIGYRQELSEFFNITSNTHSPIIGISYDGNPIYGPYGFSDPNNNQSEIKLLTSGYKLDETKVTNRPSSFERGYFTDDYIYTGSGDLDQYNGRFCKTPEFPNGVYAYFAVASFTGVELVAQYPYFIKKYRNKPIVDNIGNSLYANIDFSSLKRNTTPYLESNNNSRYDFFVTPKSVTTNTVEIDSTLNGNIDNILIESSGSDFKVGDKLEFTSLESGYGLDARVSEVSGKSITDLSTVYNSYQDSKLYKVSDYEYEIKILPSHNVLNNSKFNVSGLNTSFEFINGEHTASVNSFETKLSTQLTYQSNDVGIITDIVVDNMPPSALVSIGGSILIDDGVVKHYYEVLNTFEDNNTLRCLKTTGVDDNIAVGKPVSILPTKLYFQTKTKTLDYTERERKFIYFNPTERIAITETSGTTVPLSFDIGNTSINVEIPSQSIYLKNHNLSNGQKVSFNRENTTRQPFGIKDDENKKSTLFSAGETTREVFVIKKSKDLIGIATRSEDVYGTNGVYFYDEASTLYSNEGDYFINSLEQEVTCEVDQIISTVSVSTSHQLANDDLITLNVVPNLVTGVGDTTSVSLKYFSDIDDLSVKEFIVNTDNIDLEKNSIQILNHQLNDGDALYYTAQEIVGGISTGIYYVSKYDNNKIQLSQTHKNSISDVPVIIDFTSKPNASELQNFYLISPQINVIKNNDLKFDLSDSSLEGYNFDFYSDRNLNKKFISSGKDLNFVVSGVGTAGVTTTASKTLTFSSNNPETLYYGLSNSDRKVVSKINSKNSSSIQQIDSVYNRQVSIFDSEDTRFSFYLDYVPEKLNYLPSDCDKLEYKTSSKTTSGSVTEVGIFNSGYLYDNVPKYSGSNSSAGNSELFIAESSTVGKLNSFEFKNTGFEYPSDPTLEPKIKFADQANISDTQYITDIEIIDGGYGFYYDPEVVLINSITGEKLDKGSLSVTLSNGSPGSKSIIAIDINTPINGLPNRPIEVRTINNTNSIRIEEVEVSLTGIVTCTINTPLDGYPTNSQPFKIGDKVFVENIDNIGLDTGIGYNSDSHGYAFFDVTNFANTNPATVVLQIPKLYGNPGVALTSQLNTYASLTNKKYYPEFKVSQEYAEFLEGERILVLETNGDVIETDLTIIKSYQNKLKFFGNYKLKSNDIIRGSYTGYEAKILSPIGVDSVLKVGHQKKNDIGWLNDIGKTSVDTQFLPDNDYYQNLSYTIKSEKTWSDISTIINSTVHPIGTKNFADTQIDTDASSTVSIGTARDAVVESVTSLLSQGDTKEIRNFEMVVDNDVINDTVSDEIKFQNIKLTSYNLLQTNRVLDFDDVSSQFASTDDNEREDIIPITSGYNKPFRKFLIQAKNPFDPDEIGDPITQIQLSELILLSDTTDVVYAEKYSLSNIGIGTLHVVENSKYFDVYPEIDESLNIKLYFDPEDKFNSDYDIKIISTDVDDSVNLNGTKDYEHVQLIGDIRSVSNQGVEFLQSFNTSEYSSFISEIVVMNMKNTDDGIPADRSVEYIEISSVNNGTDQVYADFIFDSRNKIESENKYARIIPFMSGGKVNLVCTNLLDNPIRVISKTTVFNSPSNSNVGIGSTLQFVLPNQGEETVRTALTEATYSEIVGLTTIRSYDINLFSSFKSTIQVVSGDSVSLHQVIGVHDTLNSYITESSIVGTEWSGDGNVPNHVGFFTSFVESQNFNLAFVPYSETDTIKITQYNTAFYKFFDTNINPDPISYTPLSENFSKKVYYGRNSPNASRKTFAATHKGVPIFTKTFDPEINTILDPSTGIFTIPNHFFSDKEQLIYEPGASFVGLGFSAMHINPSTDISGITTDILPRDLFVVRISDSQFKLATNKSDAENSVGVTFTYTGIGNAHTLTMAKSDSKSLVSVDNLVQYPITSINIRHQVNTNIGIADTYLNLTGISSIFPTDILKINDEFVRVVDVGVAENLTGPITYLTGNYNLVEVERGVVGSDASAHSQNDDVDVFRGSYRISGTNIEFVDAPRGAPGGDEEKDESNLPKVRSKFNARAFLRQSYESNQIFDDFSAQFDGVRRSFELTNLGISTIGFNTVSSNPNAVSSSDPDTVGAGNGMLFINGMYQKPQTLNADTYDFFVTQDSESGVSTVTFTGNNLLNPVINEYDVNTNQIPRGGLIVSLGSTAGLGYAPLFGASVYLRTDANGGISEVVGVATTGTAFEGITDADYNHETGRLRVYTSSDNLGILTAFDTRFVKLVGLSFTCSGYDNDGSSLVYPDHDNPMSLVGILTDSFIVDVGISTIIHHYVEGSGGKVFPYYDRLTFGSGYNEYKHPSEGRQPISYELAFDSHDGTDATFNIDVIEGGELDIQVTNVGSGYSNPYLKIETPDYEHLEVEGISRLGVGNTTDTGVGLLMNVEIGANTNVDAQPVGLGSTFFNVSRFKITRPGYKFRVGDVFTPVGLVTAKGYSEPIDKFRLVVLDTFNDNCSVFQLGEFNYLDSIRKYQNGKRLVFPLAYDSRRISFEADPSNPDSALINKDSLLVVFINGIIQIPNESYTFRGGSSIRFFEAPNENDIIEMFFYVGTRGVDSTINLVDETIKIGDQLKIQNLPSDISTKDQDNRTVHDLLTSTELRTNPYRGQGINEIVSRPVTWIKQTQDLVVDELTYTKSRNSLEPQIYPVARLIYDLTESDTNVWVDNAALFEYETTISKHNLIIIPNQEVSVGLATAIVADDSTISSIDATVYNGRGYVTEPVVKIANPIIGIGTNRSWYNVGIGTTGDVGIGTTATATATILSTGRINTISLTNPGSGYTNTNPPQVLIENPTGIYEEVTFVDTVEGFSGSIIGIGTTSGVGTELAIEFEIRSTSRPADDGYENSVVSPLKVGYPIYISETNVGNGLTSIDNNENEIIGISTQFVDNIYIIKQISTTTNNTGIITCNIAFDRDISDYVGIASTAVSYSQPVGKFSWGRLIGFNRSNSPISITVNGGVVSGLTTYPEIRRTGFKPGKIRDADAAGLRNTGALDNTV